MGVENLTIEIANEKLGMLLTEIGETNCCNLDREKQLKEAMKILEKFPVLRENYEPLLNLYQIKYSLE